MEGGRWVRLVAASGLVLLGGCIGFATPPATLTVSKGPAVGDVHSYDGDRMLTQLHADLRPLGAVEELRARQVDVGAGAVADLTSDGLYTVGPDLSISYNLVPALEGQASLRTYVTGYGAWLWTVEGHQGPGAGVAIGTELVGFVNGSTGGVGKGAMAGVAGHGELGFGLEAGLDGRLVGPERYALFRLGLRLRMPLSAGMAFFPGLIRAFGRH